MKYSQIMGWKGSICTSVIFLFIGFQSALGQISLLNTPPVMLVDRNWKIQESEPVGSVIARVKAEDAENDLLQFGLEPLYHPNFANPNEKGPTKDKLPFRIDPNTGVVYLNESLEGRGGENFLLYITVSDGQLTAKNEVYVNIYAKEDKNIYSSRNPALPHSTQNISQLFPPFNLLPGVQSSNIGGNIGRRPPNLAVNNFPPSSVLNNSPYFPLYNINNNNNNNDNNEERLPNRPSSSSSAEDDDYLNSGLHPSHPVNKKSDSNNDNFDNNNGGNGSGSPHRTILVPINNKNSKENSNSSTIAISGGGNKDYSETNSIEDSVLNSEKIEKSQEAYPTKAVIPVIITICGIFLVASLIALFIYRKHLCAIGKSLKKKSKEEMTKKSNQSNISSNITDDSRNSIVLHHWNGPTAFCNRYVPWDREGQHTFATSQLSTSSSIGNLQAKTDRWEFPRHRLKFFNILGEGAFGQVWRCEATDVDGKEGITTVAVKTLKENASEVERNDLHSELQVMKSLETHINVVRLLGCCTDKEPIFVIIEYVNRGKLQTYLRNSRAERHYGNTHGKSNVLTSGDLTSFMYQVARGMDFLSSRGIIHRDLAARNILITDDHTCKVADFGFARDVVTSKVYERKSEGKLPIRWMAIESLYDNIFSVKSDIWSFGILMWEIVTLGSTPYPGISASDVMKKVRDGYRLEKPEHCRRELYNIMYYCWASDPNERPSFSELVQLLDKLLHTEMDYIELERFPDHNYYNILNLSGEKL